MSVVYGLGSMWGRFALQIFRTKGEVRLDHVAACIVTLFVHLLIAFCLLRTAREESSSAGSKMGRSDTGLLVTYIDLTPDAEHDQADKQKEVSQPAVSKHAYTAMDGAVESERTSRDDGAVLSERENLLSDYPSHEAQTTTAPSQDSSDSATVKRAREDAARSDLLENYHDALRMAIRHKWASLTRQPFPPECILQISQAAGGVVTEAKAGNCDLSQEDSLRLEIAALLAQPLPYEGFESVFSDEILLAF